MKGRVKKILRSLSLLLLIFFSAFAFIFSNIPLNDTYAAEPLSLVDEIKDLNNQILDRSEDLSDGASESEIEDISDMALKRKPKLKELIEKEPEKVKDVILDSSNFPEAVRANFENKVDQKGFTRSFHVDKEDGNYSESYYLYETKDFSGKSWKLEPDKKNSPIATGQELTVTGYQVDESIWFESSVNQQLSVFSVTSAGPVTGTRRINVFYPTFTDDRTRTTSEQNIRDYYFGFQSSGLNAFLKDSSHSRLSVTGEVHPVDLTIQKTCERSLVTEIERVAGEMVIDTTSVDDNFIYLGSNVSCGQWAGAVWRGTNWAYAIGFTPVPHELGHRMGLAHADGYDCGNLIIYETCELKSYGNIYDVMGSFGSDYGGYFKEYLGWLETGDIYNISSNGTYRIYKMDELTTPRVIKIRTFSGGPVYYVALKAKDGDYRAVIELASGEVAEWRRTGMLDMTPGSASSVPDDFLDGYLHEGQEYYDPYNGIRIKAVDVVGYADIEVKINEPRAGTASFSAGWNIPKGYLSAVGQKKTVDWEEQRYIMSHRCTQGYGCNPNVWVDEPATTGISGSFLAANSNLGYRYEYRVLILTKKDGDPSRVELYPWIGPTAASTDCQGATSCQLTVSWPKVTYKVYLLRLDNGLPACYQYSPCQDFLWGQDGTVFTFRGLPTGINFKAKVEIADFGGGVHLLQEFGDLGMSESYFGSCSSYPTSCVIPVFTFMGNERIIYSVKLNNQEGVILEGPELRSAGSDGAFVENWRWNYEILTFPDGFANCTVAGNLCERGYIYNSISSSNSYTFVGLISNERYKVKVCAVSCAQNNSSVSETTQITSSFGPSFFSSDPFAIADSDSDGLYDYEDNCPTVSNPNQENNDGKMGNGPYSGDDNSHPMGDNIGDACDSDNDNDQLADTDEQILANCASFNGVTANHPNPVKGDITNNDGNGPSWDTDGDGVLDGVECRVGTNPRAGSLNDRTSCRDFAQNLLVRQASGDEDQDGLSNSWEFCTWGTNPFVADSDNDGLKDCKEVADVTGNGSADDSDRILVARARYGLAQGDWNFDVNGNAIIDDTDRIFVARVALNIICK